MPGRIDTDFSSFGKRLTRSYVVLALALIVLVAGTSTILTFSLYARDLDDSMGTMMQEVVSEASYFEEHHVPLAEAAAKILGDSDHSGLVITINDSQHQKQLATNVGRRHPQRDSLGARLFETAALLFGLHPAFAHTAGMDIEIYPDFSRLGTLFIIYWTIVLSVCAIALIAAWLIARNITRRAIDPLVEVTRSLHGIAAGDFQPEPLLRDSGELGALIGAYNDVAYRLTAASKEREQNALQMRQFIADAGHELRTPLTVVMGYLDVLRGGVVRDPNGISHIYQTMLQESRRMKTLVDKLIFLARLERPEAADKRTLDIRSLVERIARQLEPIAGHRIRIVGGSSHVIGDESELSQALDNVVQNALKYAPQSDVIVRMSSHDGFAQVEVSDRGPGMNEQDVAHAFDRFYRGSARVNADGSGLGLAIAKRAMERAGGTIAVRSTLGEGTTVILQLPVDASAPAASEESTPATMAR